MGTNNKKVFTVEEVADLIDNIFGDDLSSIGDAYCREVCPHKVKGICQFDDHCVITNDKKMVLDYLKHHCK